MKFRFLSVVAGVLLPIVANAAMPHVGFYQTIDDETKTPSVLNVRGKIGPFGRTQYWNILSVSDLPSDLQNLDTSNWIPKIIK